MTHEKFNQSSLLKIGTVLRGIYRIDSYLSSGGFGNTYLATNIEFDERIAVKEFFMKGISERDAEGQSISVSNAHNADLFDKQRDKFKKEARRLRRFQSDHIVRVYDLFEENGTAYYVMDYIEGESLRDMLKRTGEPIAEARLANDYLPQMLDALRTMHSEGIWHLDIKPGNIMVDRRGTLKLIDFGASKQMSADGEGATSTSAYSYTQGYAPVEQIQQKAENIGPWTDFYALGATLYNLLTNQSPADIDFDEDGDAGYRFPSEVSERMRGLVVWCMKTRRRDRPSSVADIEKYLSSGESSHDQTLDGENNYVRRDNEETIYIDVENKDDNRIYCKDIKVIGKLRKSFFMAVMAIFIIVLAVQCINVFINARKEKATKMKIVQGIVDNMVTINVDDDVQDDLGERSFRINKYEVSQKEWQSVMGYNPVLGDTSFSAPKIGILRLYVGDDRPICRVTYKDCEEFINKLNSLTGRHFRLPTLREFDYSGYQFNLPDEEIKFTNLGWMFDNSESKLHNRGEINAMNKFGLYDTFGNVDEYCSDSGKYVIAGFNFYSAPPYDKEFSEIVSPNYESYCTGMRLAESIDE